MPATLQIWYRRLGKSGFTGALMLWVAGLIYLLGSLPAQRHSNELHITQQTLQANQRTVASQVQPAATTVTFASRDALPDVLRNIFELAAKQALDLEIGEYKYSQSQEDALLKYEMSLPLEGRYQDIRHFLQSLGSIPYLTIKSLDLKRSDVSEASVDAKLQLVLYLAPDKGSRVQ